MNIPVHPTNFARDMDLSIDFGIHVEHNRIEGWNVCISHTRCVYRIKSCYEFGKRSILVYFYVIFFHSPLDFPARVTLQKHNCSYVTITFFFNRLNCILLLLLFFKNYTVLILPLTWGGQWMGKWVSDSHEKQQNIMHLQSNSGMLFISRQARVGVSEPLLWLHLLWSRDRDRDRDDQKDIKRWRWDTFGVIIFPGFDTKKEIQRNRR